MGRGREAERWRDRWLLGFGIWGPGKSTSSECHYNCRPFYWACSDFPGGNAKGHSSMEISGNIKQNHMCFYNFTYSNFCCAGPSLLHGLFSSRGKQGLLSSCRV